MSRTFPLEEFDADAVRKVVLDEIQKTLASRKYEPEKNNFYAKKISENVLKRIAPSGEGYLKYVTHMTIGPAEFSGFDEFSVNLWDEETDGMTVVNYETYYLRCTFVIWGVKAV